MTARLLIGDVFDRLAEIEDGSIDLVITSPPFLALRSYLPADHPDKAKEIGSEATPAEFIDVMLRVTQELRRVLAPHGSIAIELGDTYARSGGGGGDYLEGGMREGQQQFAGSAASMRESNAAHWRQKNAWKQGELATYSDARGNPDGMRDPRFSGANTRTGKGQGWPLAKSKTLIPQLYQIALAYGINPLTGQPSPAGQWRVRNVVTWCRPNPPVGALGDKWRPATSDVVVACISEKRYWDDLATRKPFEEIKDRRYRTTNGPKQGADPAEVLTDSYSQRVPGNASGAPLLDYWEIPPPGYGGAHYAVYPPDLVVPLVKAMCPEKVCRECGEPSRRIVGEPEYVDNDGLLIEPKVWRSSISAGLGAHTKQRTSVTRVDLTLGWTDCGHDDWRRGVILDLFAGTGTTLLVATGHGLDAIGIDLDERNAELAYERIGGLFLEVIR